jgi:hypothetical protein
MKRKIQTWTGVLFILMGLLSFTMEAKSKMSAQQNWEMLGRKVADFKADRDVIRVTAKEGVYTKVKFRVLKAPLHVIDMKIHFRNGDVKDVPLKKLFAAGNSSRVIDLPGNKRIIQKVSFKYKSVPGNGKGRAVIVLSGRH